MQVYRSIDEARGELDAPVITLGNFDGIHLGHQALVDEVLTRARAGDHPAAAMTFDPHPVSVLAPHKALAPSRACIGSPPACLQDSGLELHQYR